ncbi:class I SAM-dependent methyltransferase [Candidatus Methylocalor cossyra]|uniref:16S rRNA (Guanine(1207)-N(2))-methyltransferase n=1 Tax=Candidatus Methylocalor cossyra TaxID=3108543 RepID=A0ABM9NIR9_9GAMM
MTLHRLQAAALDSYLDRHPDTIADGPVAVFRALPGRYLARFGGRPVACQQTYRPLAAELARLGFDPLAEPTGPLDLAVVFATKHREEVLYHLARAVSLLADGGPLLAVAANALGAGALEKRCAELLGGVETYSKHKCRVILGRKDPARLDRARLETWLRGGAWQRIAGSELVTRPGLFSWKSEDPGSRLLAAHLPADLAGRGADLGTGYGYLSWALLARARKVSELHLCDAEHTALEAAARNLAGRSGDARLHFHWIDVTAGLPLAGLDFVIMNPPFHGPRAACPDLGRAFIAAALGALAPGGRLWLVANRHLPYEAEIAAHTGQIERRIESQGFKVLAARKRGCARPR